MRDQIRTLSACLICMWLFACGSDPAPTDAGPPDAGAIGDANDNDASETDASIVDAGFEEDAGTNDAGGPVDTGPIPTSALDLNDISILWPLPAGEPRAAFLWVSPRAGESGPYFPLHRIDELPPPLSDFPLDPGEANMVVGLRFDPCFRDTSADGCEPQIRLVAQPVLYEDGQDPALLDDTALHLFYSLSPAEVPTVLAALRQIRDLSPVPTTGPLSVHPGLVDEGAGGPVGSAVRDLVVAMCRADNLVRVTSNSFAFDIWTFARFDWIEDHLVPIDIPSLGAASTFQSWLRQAFVDDLDDPAGKISPAPVESFTYLLDLDNYQVLDPIELEPAVDLIARVENPQAVQTGEVDCVTCHAGAQLQLYADRRGISFSQAADPYSAPSAVDVSQELDAEIRGNLGDTIMFGYHHLTNDRAVPSISRRVIFESAEIVDRLRN